MSLESQGAYKFRDLAIKGFIMDSCTGYKFGSFMKYFKEAGKLNELGLKLAAKNEEACDADVAFLPDDYQQRESDDGGEVVFVDDGY